MRIWGIKNEFYIWSCFLCLLLVISVSQPAEATGQTNWVKIWEVYGRNGAVTAVFIDESTIQFSNNYNNARAYTQIVTNYSRSVTGGWSEFRLPNQSAILTVCITNDEGADLGCTNFFEYGPPNFRTIAIGSDQEAAMDYIWSKIGYKRKRPPGTG